MNNRTMTKKQETKMVTSNQKENVTASKTNNERRPMYLPKVVEDLMITFAKEEWDNSFMILLLLGEFLLSCLIVWKVPYTEIDWVAYMEEVSMWLDGEYDYRNIYGNTGPLVYPAGFLYLFGFLQWVTDSNVSTAQLIFIFFYLLTQYIVLQLYTTVLQYIRRRDALQKAYTNVQISYKVWSFRLTTMVCLCLSKRYHSIFLLRLFNDGTTMLVAYLSFLCFIHHKWNIGCFLFSIAVSIKMNVLLFAPGLLYLLLQDSIVLTIPRLAICAITQLIIGAPFLLRFPISYLRKAFELDRQFFYKWTVNFKFLPEEWFLSTRWSILLLLLHLGLLGFYFWKLYTTTTKMSRSNKVQQWSSSSTTTKDLSSSSLTPDYILSVLFISNFIGICCARTLHYQFYSWYFSTLPFLLWHGTSYPVIVRLILLGCIEYAFLTFPATMLSSGLLQVAHFSILIPNVLLSTLLSMDSSSNSSSSSLSKKKKS